MYKIINGETDLMTDLVIKEERNKIIQTCAKSNIPFELTDKGDVIIKIHKNNDNIEIIDNLFKLNKKENIITSMRDIILGANSEFVNYNGKILLNKNNYVGTQKYNNFIANIIISTRDSDIEWINNETELL